MLGWVRTPALEEDGMTAWDFSFASIDGGDLPLAQYRGKVVLVVNTASYCGLTPQYEGLQGLYRSYRDGGFVLLGVPSNDFGQQEPGTAAEIKTFCTTKFAVDFPLAGKKAWSATPPIRSIVGWWPRRAGTQRRAGTSTRC